MKQENNKAFDASFYKSVEQELINDILPFWEKNACDTRQAVKASTAQSAVPDRRMLKLPVPS